MTQLAHLDSNEVTAWLTRVTQTIDRSLRDPVRAQAADALRRGVPGKVALPVLAQLALLDDCLRVAHLAIEADGRTDSDELARVAELVRVAAQKYFAALAPYEAFGDGAETPEDVARFLRMHRDETTPFGFGHGEQWRGLHLARLVEQHTRNASPLRDHERMLSRIMDEVFGGRATEIERDARRRLRDLFEQRSTTTDADPRVLVFCREDAPEVFSSVAHGSQVFERDPFDVESIHADVREVFHRQVERATTPEQHSRGHGRTLLVLGESGAGKTHLLRALRTQVHAQRVGYVGYLQMTSEVGDYSRYVLRSLIDSLERPYDTPSLSESGLVYLSDGLTEGRVQIPPEELEQLRTSELTSDELAAVVGRIIDRIVRSEGLEQLEVDLLHALLLLQRRDAAIQRRVVRLLRCEPLTSYDRNLLGGLSARDQPEDPLRTIQQLARIMYELHMAALVLVVDQIEETIPDGQTVTRIQQAFDSLRAIADAVPSAVVVISCLDDVYDAIRPKLSRSLVDRLERDPTPVRLGSQRQPDEIEQMLVRRLEYLFSHFDVPWRDDEPIFPFTPAHVEAVRNFRARDCLAKFREYHASCMEAGAIVPFTGADDATIRTTVPDARAATAPGVTPAALRPPLDLAKIERAWNDILASNPKLPDDDDQILALLADGLRHAASDLGIEVTVTHAAHAKLEHLVVDSKTLPRRLIALCNGRGQGGHLGRQLDALRELAKAGTPTYALRTSDWHFGAKSPTQKRVIELKQAGGHTVVLEERELRAIAAMKTFVEANPTNLAEWRRANHPIAQLAFARELLDLDRAPVVAKPPAPVTPAPLPPLPAVPAPRPRASAQIGAVDPAQIRLGATTTMRAEPVGLPLEQIKKHVAFLGSPGSGKTTIALSVVEQLLERDISVLLVDRKGDLARYASEAWWTEPTGDIERKAKLRDKIDVALYTPGNAHGRPLRLPLIPSLRDASKQERDQLARYAASGLTAMMGLGRGVATTHKESVLKCAIELLAEEREVTLALLHETISRPDPQLLMAVDSLQKHFAPLGECLQALKIQRGDLLTGEGETLDVATLLPAPGSARPRLTIINTGALSEVAVLQFWVSRLLVDLGRLARTRPSGTLQAAAFFDEADAYVPASTSPPTKEPMFDLLKRARSGGIGIMLATQNPGDFDYKARDNIQTWLVGKVSQDRAIEKMRNLLGSYPNVGPRLASQATGHFFVLSEGQPKEIRADRALMQTEQLGDTELVELARSSSR